MEDPKAEVPIMVPVSFNQLIGIEHRLTKLETRVGIGIATGSIAAAGVVALLVDLLVRGLR
jgi:hypothetical protein